MFVPQLLCGLWTYGHQTWHGGRGWAVKYYRKIRVGTPLKIIGLWESGREPHWQGASATNLEEEGQERLMLFVGNLHTCTCKMVSAYPVGAPLLKLNGWANSPQKASIALCHWVDFHWNMCHFFTNSEPSNVYQYRPWMRKSAALCIQHILGAVINYDWRRGSRGTRCTFLSTGRLKGSVLAYLIGSNLYEKYWSPFSPHITNFKPLLLPSRHK